MPYLSVSEVARQHFPGLPPKRISDLFYRREMPGADQDCPVVAGRRLIPVAYVETIRLALRRAGHLQRLEALAR